MNIRYRVDVESFSKMLFDILLSKIINKLSDLSASLIENRVDAALAFANFLDSIFIFKDIMDNIKLSNMILWVVDS